MMATRRNDPMMQIDPATMYATSKLTHGEVDVVSMRMAEIGEAERYTKEASANDSPRAVSTASTPTRSTMMTGYSDAKQPMPEPNTNAYTHISGYEESKGIKVEASPARNNIVVAKHMR